MYESLGGNNSAQILNETKTFKFFLVILFFLSFIKHLNYFSSHIFSLLFKAFTTEGFKIINALEKGKENNKKSPP